MLKQKNNQVEDIFGDTDKAKNKSGAPRAAKPEPQINSRLSKNQATTPSALDMSSDSLLVRKKIIRVLMIAAVIMVAAAVIIFLYSRSQQPAGQTNLNSANNNKSVANQASANSAVITTPVINTAAVDSDGDGLTDDEEKNLGTNPNSKDTDNDGLFDREEAKVYHTDPLNADTDGDGVNDGTEVRNGYNPKGTGQLLDLPSAIQNLNK